MIKDNSCVSVETNIDTCPFEGNGRRGHEVILCGKVREKRSIRAGGRGGKAKIVVMERCSL